MDFLEGAAGWIGIVLFLGMMAVGFPVFVAMGLSAFIGFLLVHPFSIAIHSFMEIVWQSASIYELIAVPLFVLAGTVMQKTDAGRDLFDVTKQLIGRIPNATSVATILACGIFAAVSGSSIACAATVGLAAIPLLRENGYSDSRAGGVVAAGGTLGILIPPSVPMILYGVITETSIGQLFMAGVIPGLIMMSLFVVCATLQRPTIRHHERLDLRQKLLVLRRSSGVLMLPILIMGSIYAGVFTPTETGALAVAYVVALGLLQRRLTLDGFISAAKAATRTSGMLLMLVVFGQYFAHFMTYEQLPQAIAEGIISVPGGKFVTLSLMILAYVALGMFLESAAMLLISIPIFFPVAQSVGMDPLVFGIFAVVAMEVAQITPPVGVNLFTIHGISRIPLMRLARGCAPYILIQVVMMYVIAYVPKLSTWLPSHMH